MKRFFLLFLIFMGVVEISAQNINDINDQLLDAINNKDVQKVIDACNNGADFYSFTEDQVRELDFDNYIHVYNEIDDVYTKIVFDWFNLALNKRDKSRVAEIIVELATSYYTLGDYESSESLYKEALTIQKQELGEQHQDYARTLNNLGVLYLEMGKYTLSEQLNKEALKINRQIFGEMHPKYATSLNNLALLYSKKGEYVSAELLYKEALQICVENFGDRHPYYATILNNIAELYIKNGDYSDAEVLLKKSILIISDTLGEQHPDFLRGLNNLAYLYTGLKILNQQSYYIKNVRTQ